MSVTPPMDPVQVHLGPCNKTVDGKTGKRCSYCNGHGSIFLCQPELMDDPEFHQKCKEYAHTAKRCQHCITRETYNRLQDESSKANDNWQDAPGGIIGGAASPVRATRFAPRESSNEGSDGAVRGSETPIPSTPVGEHPGGGQFELNWEESDG